MKYTITINQAGIVKANLMSKTDLTDWAIIDYLHSWYFVRNRKSVWVEEKARHYIWVNYQHLINEMPMLGIRDKDALTKRFKKLRGLRLIDTFQAADNTLYFCLTDLCVSVAFIKETDPGPGPDRQADTLPPESGQAILPQSDRAVLPQSDSTSSIPVSSIPVSSNSTSTTRAIQDRYVQLLGYNPGDWAAGESKAAKAIADKWTPDQLETAYRHFKAQSFWADKRLTLAYLKKQMPELFKNGNGNGTQPTRDTGAGAAQTTPGVSRAVQAIAERARAAAGVDMPVLPTPPAAD